MTAAFRVVCGCFCATRMDPRGCDPDCMACRAQGTYFPTLGEEADQAWS